MLASASTGLESGIQGEFPKGEVYAFAAWFVSPFGLVRFPTATERSNNGLIPII
jgi:hypothetical protein